MNPDFLPFMQELAHAAGQAIAPYFRTDGITDNKAAGGAFDPVTEGDRAGEAAMRSLIADAHPEHGIIGEEYGISNGDADYVWVLDPIDGTRSFISGIPTWGTLIGLTHKGIPVAGMMAQGFTNERFFGDGNTAFYRGPGGTRPLQARACASLAEATLFTTDPRLFQETERERYLAVESTVRLTRYSADCYAYCMVAAGHADLVIESGLKPHDIVALIPIIESAGGIITSWDGRPATQGGTVVAAGDRRVHEAAMRVLNAT